MVDKDKYRKVVEKRSSGSDEKSGKDDEIRITAKGRTALYVTYAGKLMTEKNLDSFTLKATGVALATAVTVAEVLKRRYKGLHQITKLGVVEVTDNWEPKDAAAGLEPITTSRNVSFIEITLSTKELDKADKGYQEPLDESLVEEVDGETEQKKGERRGKGNGKGGKGKEKGGKEKGGKRSSGKRGSKGKGKKEKNGTSPE